MIDQHASYAQESVWYLEKLHPGMAANRRLSLWHLCGSVNVHALQQSLDTVVSRHDALRTTFSSSEAGPVLKVLASMTTVIRYRDLDPSVSPASPASIAQMVDAELSQPMDLETGPLVRVSLYGGAEECLLLISMHNINCDAFSERLFLKELAAYYSVTTTGKAMLPIPKSGVYAEYARRQREGVSGDEGMNHLAYWKQTLSDYPAELGLPTDRSRPAVLSNSGDVALFVISNERLTALRSLCARSDVSLLTALTAILNTLLLRYSGNDDILIGSPLNMRDEDTEEGLLGFCTNMCVLRTDMSGDPSFLDTLKRVDRVIEKALLHRDIALEVLIEELGVVRERSRSPLFQVGIELAENPCLELAGIEAHPKCIEGPGSHLDLYFRMGDSTDAITGTVVYNTDLFDASTIQSMMNRFQMIIDAVTGDPALPASELPLLSADEREQMRAWQGRDLPGFGDISFLDRLTAQVDSTPHRVAIEFRDDQITFQQLHERANQVAAFLATQGVGPEILVGVFMERSVEMVVALLGILKAGGAYVPLDPEYPEDRIGFMLEDTKIAILLTQGTLRDRLPQTGARVWCLDTDWNQFELLSTEQMPVPTTDESLAYVIYTSGSTGRPKGVMITHAALRNHMCWMQQDLPLADSDRLLQKTSISFDASGWEIWLPIMAGARLILAEPGSQRDPINLIRQIQEKEITVLQMVPSHLELLTEITGWSSCTTLRRICCGGESLNTELIKTVRSHLDNIEIVNLYGPTESTIDVLWWHLLPGESIPSIVPVGRPVSNTQVYILDASMEPVPVGMTGEIYIGGHQIARGYLNRDDLTEERFTSDPFCERDDSFLYMTGDLGRRQTDGQIEYIGRNDSQVKIRGYRIEIGEIERVVRQHTGTRDTLVMDREDLPGDHRLVAYVIPSDPDYSTSNLRDFLNQKLPDYMVPSAFVVLDSFPITISGKTDRRALPTPDYGTQEGTAYEAPTDDVEGAIAQIWQKILSLEKVGVHDNFFDMGGHSLLVVKAQSQLNKLGYGEVSITDLFTHPTISTLALFLSGNGCASTLSNVKRVSARERGSVAGQSKDIAIIGMSGRFPGARNIDEFWDNLCQGIESITTFSDEEILSSGVAPASVMNPDYVKKGMIIEDAELFDAEFFGYSPREAEIMDPQQRIFMECAWEALEHAGYAPRDYEGSIGVYAGMSTNNYLLYNLWSHPDIRNSSGGKQVQISVGNSKDFLSTQVSYKLNLTGPSISIQTACSTSLVAIQTACQELLSGGCDMALSGAVCIRIPRKGGYLYEEGLMYSPDGHCRSFDAKASGTHFGDGAGTVLLKRLEDAVHDGDTIHAIIKGVGTNNDGSEKVGYTAPSVNGQAAAITAALAQGDVDPETISYIEAHGTATPLGDPIEIAALKQAFDATGATSKQYCALGSVKSNIGHLDAAAGMAGLLKTVLALKHKQIPASLHYESPNPEIDFANSPFYVNARLSDWEHVEGPRRAGVSSFGFGGTNAHVILEEAPQVVDATTSSSWQILPLSARTEEELGLASGNLANHLKQYPASNLTDVAFTLQMGRQRFEYGRFLVSRNASEAIQALDSGDGCFDGRQEPTNRSVVFMFSGQGSQYPDMGAELYHTNEIFKQHMDRCFEIVRPHLDRDLRDVIFPTDTAKRALNDDETALARETLNETRYAQPALFALEYALARTWMAWGIRPDAMIGHSVGEYVAACLSGVMSLEDALPLVALRGQLMQELPRGAMLAVPLSPDEMEPFLNDQLDLATVNTPTQCTVSGTIQAIRELEERLTLEQIACRPLHTSHAFHSHMMDPILPELFKRLKGIQLRTPQIPYLSNLTGTWVSDVEATDPEYWASHVRITVRFSEGISELAKAPRKVYLEVGPGNTLTTFVRRSGQDVAAGEALSSLPHPREQTLDAPYTLNTLGKLWLAGIDIDWAAVHGGEERRRIALPTYPFSRRRYWIDPNLGEYATGAPVSANEEVPYREIMGETMMPLIASPTRKDKILAHLQATMEDISGLDISNDAPDTTFLAMGFDSLFLTQASLAIKNEFKVDLTFRQMIEDYPTLGSLVDFLEQEMDPALLPEIPASTPASDSPSVVGAPIPVAEVAAQISPTSSGGIEQVIAQQMQIMQQQLTLLSNAGLGGQPAGIPATAPVVASLPVSAIADPTATPEVDTTPELSEDDKTVPEKVKDSKPFGAIARINTTVNDDLTSEQHVFLIELISSYNERTRSSKAFSEEHRPHMSDPRVVSGFKPAIKELIYPIVVERSDGSHMWDMDGNEYIDALNGFGANFMGYNNPIVQKAVREQLDAGYETGPQQALTGEAAKLICEFTAFDRAAFCSTGSEAVLGAMRMARTVTGRKTIVVFSGSYHGIFDEVLVKGTKNLRSIPATPGVMPEAVQNVLVLEYGTESSLETIRERAPELAAVLVEPIQSRRPDFQPRDFLLEVRRITEASATALIFDEVITGFRLGPGGAQEYYGIQADIGTYGKVIGGGMPIGVVAGKSRYMDALDGGAWQFGDASTPDVGVTYFAGTFVRHPLAIAACKAVLEFLKEGGPTIQQKVNERTARLVSELNTYFDAIQVPMQAAHFSSLYRVTYTEETPYGELLFYMMRMHGIHIYDGFPCFLTISHTDEDVDKIITVFKRCAVEMKSAGFFGPAGSAATFSVLDEGTELYSCAVTESQKEVWATAQMGDGASCSFNESVTINLNGNLSVPALRRAVWELTVRHEGLRTTFSTDGLLMRVLGHMSIDLPLQDLSRLSSEEQQVVTQDCLEKEVVTPFDLEKGPLLRLRLLKYREDEHSLLFTIHHIIGDGWSNTMLLSDLGKLYHAAITGESSNLPPAYKFSSYAAHLTDKLGADESLAAERYWVDVYRDSVPVVNLPTDRSRSKLRTFDGWREELAMDSQLVTALKRLGASAQSTFFTTMFASFNVYMTRLTNQEDIVVGVPAAGQSAVGQENLIGHCINMLPIRSQISVQSSFKEVLSGMRQVVLDAYDNQQYTFGSLIPQIPLVRDPSRIPLVPMTFNIDQESRELSFGSLTAIYKTHPRRYENFEFTMNAVEYRDNVVVLEGTYNTNLFDGETIQRRLREFVAMLQGMVSNPDCPISELPILDPQEADLLASWNDTAADYPHDKCVHQLIEEQVKLTPDAVALGFENVTLSYCELHDRSNQLARHLMRSGVEPGSLVGVFMERSAEMVVGLLGIWKAGASYVPLDPAYPSQRIAYMVSDSELRTVLTEQVLIDQLPDYNGQIVSMDGDHREISNQTRDELGPISSCDDVAYVIYTSGSTGKPKGVQISHGALTNFLCSMQHEPGISRDDVLASVTTLSFDISGLEIFLPLISGAQLQILSREVAVNGNSLSEAMDACGATIVQATPATWRMLLDAGWAGRPTLKMLCGGEAMSGDLAERLQDKGAELWNMYGPTETTIWSSVARITDGHDVTIGRPIANTRFHILDANYKQVPIGAVGALYIGGDGVARGYLKRPELTKERFVRDCFSAVDDARIYDTGDLARYLPDGRVECLGRKDNQVKIRGFRIELDEIEATLDLHAIVSQNGVVVREVGGEDVLAAYVVAEESEDLTTDALRTFLMDRLPYYMVPSIFIRIDSLPMTPNGKVDRKALPDPEENRLKMDHEFVAPRTPTESNVSDIWQEVLEVDEVGVYDDFFALGGHSILAIRAVSRIRDGLGMDVGLAALFERPTVVAMAEFIDTLALLDSSQTDAQIEEEMEEMEI
jgi:amino acid adenylation domain-containing protein